MLLLPLSMHLFIYMYSNEKHLGECDWLSGRVTARLVDERCDCAHRFLIGSQSRGVKRTMRPVKTM